MSNELLHDEDVSWFPPVREALLATWEAKTVIPSPDGGVDSLACSLYQAIDRNTGHLSIACSLNSETDQIERLLGVDCFDDDPVLFFRLYLLLLDEFNARLEECYDLLGHPSKPKQPELISAWTNRYAKHRTAILNQHHAQHLSCDEPRSTDTVGLLRAQINVLFIDTHWLKANPKADPPSANQSRHAVVMVPPLGGFLEAAIDYYAGFRIYACANPKQLQKFQSPHHWTPMPLHEPRS